MNIQAISYPSYSVNIPTQVSGIQASSSSNTLVNPAPLPNLYTSAPIGIADLIPAQSEQAYILSAVPTPPIAGELFESGLANFFNPLWQSEVASAIAKNGGLGTAEDGFLAWSRIGFVRFYNENLSPEQNRRLAEASLEFGFQIERMPSRSDKPVSDPNIDRWVNEFIEKYQTQRSEFLAQPERGMSVRDGRKRFEVKLDPQSGQVVSYYYKKSGGLRGFVQRNFKPISTITGLVSRIAPFIPGWGTIAALGAQAVQIGANLAAAGTVKARTALAEIGRFVGSYVTGLPRR